MNLLDIAQLNCNTDDLQELLRSCELDKASLNLPFSISGEGEDQYAWIPECEYVGCLSTNDLEGAGEQTLLIVTLLKLLQQGRLEVN